MKGKFDDKARIINGGTEVEVTGPASWEDDETGATITAWVTQGEVVANGSSAFTPSSADSWSAILTVHGGTLQPGLAPTRAHAKVSLNNGKTEPYPWNDEVELVD